LEEKPASPVLLPIIICFWLCFCFCSL